MFRRVEPSDHIRTSAHRSYDLPKSPKTFTASRTTTAARRRRMQGSGEVHPGRSTPMIPLQPTPHHIPSGLLDNSCFHLPSPAISRVETLRVDPDFAHQSIKRVSFFFLLLLLPRKFPPHEVHPPAAPYSAPPERNPRSEFSVDRSEYFRYAPLAEPTRETDPSALVTLVNFFFFFFCIRNEYSARILTATPTTPLSGSGVEGRSECWWKKLSWR